LTHLTGRERGRYVQEMFGRIAPRYDLMNRLMTGGQDVAWRRETIRRARLQPGSRLLDLGAGTGDMARAALRQVPGLQALAADFTLEMMLAGRRAHPIETIGSAVLEWSAADALHLPFEAEVFDAVVSGFLLRNVGDLRQSLGEQRRVLKPGGRIVALDTTPPPRSPLVPFIRFHMHTVIPALGKLLTGQGEAYRYLPDSSESFLEPERLAACLIEAGFTGVGFTRRMFGTIGIYWGIKGKNGSA
jgi:demethylmenaquinone methyltransferase/2-methoxy-6-polyprenyl-1,4-benzoquinol methylase